MTKNIFFASFLSTLVCCVVSSALYSQESEPHAIDFSSYQVAEHLSKAFRHATQRVLPATVKVISHARTTDEIQSLKVQNPAVRQPRDTRRPGDTAGTGVIVDPNGLVVTNNHVIAKGKEIDVELPDGRKFFVKKLRVDPETDLAILWLDLSADDELPYADLGDSDLVEVGDWVLTIGNPFDLDSTVSSGIISARDRSLNKIQRTEFFQTDAAINPGNSGGPLVNLKGEVIGINTAIASITGLGQGLGFALPSNNARWIIEQLVRKGRVDRAWLGAVTYPVTILEARRLGVKPHEGLFVDYVLDQSPGSKAKLQSDDVILAFDDAPVNAIHQFQRLVERADLTKGHDLTIIRNRKKFSLPIKLELLPVVPLANRLIGDAVQPYVDEQLGLLMIQATEAMIDRLRYTGKQGMVVMSVERGGRGEKAGIEVGTLIMSVDGHAITAKQDYVAARNAGSFSDGIKIRICTPQGEEKTVTIKAGQ